MKSQIYKHIINTFFVVLVIITSSCSSKDYKNSKARELNNENTSLELSTDTAFGGVNFNISHEEAYETGLFTKTQYNNILEFKEKSIGEYEYELITAHFCNDSLYLVQVYSHQTSAFLKGINESSVCDYFHNIDKLISSKYGEAEIIGRPYSLAKDDLISGVITWMNVWISKSKTIKVGIELESNGSYRAVAYIYNNRLFDLREKIKSNSELHKSIQPMENNKL